MARFVSAMRKRGATLALSTVAMMEFAGQSPEHAQAVGVMVDMIAPQLYLQEHRPWMVCDRELLSMQGNYKGDPDCDREIFAKSCDLVYVSGGQMTWSMMLLASEVLKQLGQYPVIQKYGLRTLASLERFKELLQETKERRDYLKPQPKRVQRPWATEALTIALTRNYFGRPKLKPVWNDGIDLLHAIVPGAYCNFVVLDKGWCGRVNQAAQTLKKACIKAPIAQAFGNTPKELGKFLDTLES
jgi:hypothetical protein